MKQIKFTRLFWPFVIDLLSILFLLFGIKQIIASILVLTNIQIITQLPVVISPIQIAIIYLFESLIGTLNFYFLRKRTKETRTIVMLLSVVLIIQRWSFIVLNPDPIILKTSLLANIAYSIFMFSLIAIALYHPKNRAYFPSSE